MISVFFKSSFEKNQIIYNEYLKSRYIQHEDTYKTTYATYNNCMKMFFIWLKNSKWDYYIISKKFIKKITVIMEEYILYCKERGNNKQTINNKIVALSSFYIWASRRDLIEYNPMREKVERMENLENDRRRKSYFLTDEQIEIIFQQMEEKNFKVRDKLLFSLFLDTGARIGAIHNIKIEQVDIENCVIRDVREKMGYIVDLFFFGRTQKLLNEYLKSRKDDNPYLFIAKYKNIKHISRETIRDIIRKTGKFVGISNFYPHSIRKTAINRIYVKSQNIEIASDFANHKSSSITKNHYTQKKSFKQKKQEISRILGEINL